MGGADETMLNVFTDSGGEEDGLLRDETDLGSEPLQIQVTNIEAIKAHRTSEGVIEPFNEGDDSRFSRSRGTHECRCLACLERQVEVLNNLDVRARRVAEVDALKGDFANYFRRLETFSSGINRRDSIDSVKELRRGSTSLRNCYEAKW
jgi:hypothetical protein